MSYIDSAPGKEVQVSLIKTLQTVTEGKVRQRTMHMGHAGAAAAASAAVPAPAAA